MVKRIIGEAFEQLGQIVKQTGQQAVKLPSELAETATKQAGARPQESGVEQPQGQIPTQAQIAQKEQKRKRLITALEAEIRDIRLQRRQKLPKQITGKSGFSEEKVIKQLKVQEEGKKKLPPAVAMAKPKMGTGERRIMGGSG